MKKILFLICMLYAHCCLAESCANGGGTVVLGADGTRYCLSNPTMNWWSAFSWCEAAHGTMFDINTECYKVEGTEACPNLRNSSSYGWSANRKSTNQPYILRNENILPIGIASVYKVYCTLNDGY